MRSTQVQRGFRVIAVSRFGYLRTPLPADASPEAQADAHAALLDRLHIQRVAVVAASAGAPSAMQFALRYPDRTAALILLVPAAYPARIAQRSKGALPQQTAPAARVVFDLALSSDVFFWAAARLAPRTVLSVMLATPPAVVAQASAAEQARVARILAHLQPLGARRRGLRNDAAITPVVPRYALERIAAPTLILGVADDLYGTYAGACYSAAHIPGARFISYPRGGHVWVGHHTEAMAAIVAFLRAHHATGPHTAQRTSGLASTMYSPLRACPSRSARRRGTPRSRWNPTAKSTASQIATAVWEIAISGRR